MGFCGHFDSHKVIRVIYYVHRLKKKSQINNHLNSWTDFHSEAKQTCLFCLSIRLILFRLETQLRVEECKWKTARCRNYDQ